MQGIHSTKRALGLGSVACCLAIMIVACGGEKDAPADDQEVTDVTETLEQDLVPEPDGSSLVEITEPDVADEVAADTVVSHLDELMALGKERLSAGESLAALDAFSLALQEAPDYEPAAWGMVLARFQSSVAMFSELVGLLNFREDPSATPAPGADLFWQAHEGTIGTSIDALYQAALDQKARIDALKESDGGVFTLETGLPLVFKDAEMMNLCCDWDASDLYGISSFNNLLLAFVSFLGSQETDISLALFEETADAAPGMSNVLAHVMDVSPTIFTLMPEGGEELWSQTNDYLLASCEDALTAATLMAESEGGSPVASLSAGDHPYLVLNGSFPNGSDTLELLWEGEQVSLKAVVEKAAAHLAGAPDTRLSLDGDAMVALSVLVDILNRTIGITELASGLGFDLPEILTVIIDGLDDSDPEELALLLPSLLSMVGIDAGTVFLDLHLFLSQPFNLRDLFPNRGVDPGTPWKTFTKSFECMRGGTTLTPADTGEALTLWFHDPSETAASVPITVQTWTSDDTAGAPLDAETLTLTALEGFSGLYTGALILDSGDVPGVQEDGHVTLPEAGVLEATFTAPSDETHVISVTGTWADGFTPWDYSAACTDDAPAWDAGHFGELEFGEAVEVTAPGQTTPLEAVDADGEITRSGFMAFSSPSFDGLFWVLGDDGMAPADQASFARIFTGILSALGGF